MRQILEYDPAYSYDSGALGDSLNMAIMAGVDTRKAVKQVVEDLPPREADELIFRGLKALIEFEGLKSYIVGLLTTQGSVEYYADMEKLMTPGRIVIDVNDDDTKSVRLSYEED